MKTIFKSDIVEALKSAGFEAAHNVSKAAIGGAEIKIMRQRELVDFAVAWIERNRK